MYMEFANIKGNKNADKSAQNVIIDILLTILNSERLWF